MPEYNSKMFVISKLPAFFLLILLMGFHSGISSTGKEKSQGTVASPETTARYFPIIADDIIKTVYTANGSASIPSQDTLYYFLSKVKDANFNLVIANLTPISPFETTDQYYENFFSTLSKLNPSTDHAALNVIVYDARIKEANNFQFPAIIKKYYDRSEVYGIYYDEPRLRDFDRLASLREIFKKNHARTHKAGQTLFVNLFGVNAVRDYVNYLDQWIDQGHPEVLSFDNYSVWDDQRAKKFGDGIGADWGRDFFLNLEIFRRKSIEYNMPFWTWVSVHQSWSSYSHRYYRHSTVSDLRFQVYSSLAYGATGILYYRFWNAPIEHNQNGWHEGEAILGYNGKVTDLFQPVAELNKEVKAIGALLLHLHSVGVYHSTNDFPKQDGVVPALPLEPLYTAGKESYGIKLLKWSNESLLTKEELKDKIVLSLGNEAGLVGIFRYDETRQYYFMLVNKDRHNSQIFHVVLDSQKCSVSGKQIVIKNVRTNMQMTTQLNKDGEIMFNALLRPGDGLLFVVDSK